MQEVAKQEQTAEPDVFTVEGARAKMSMPKELQAAHVRIVEAGMKLMFDPATRDQTIAFMERPGEPAQKLGEGVASVMTLLFKESNQTMPPQLIIPCGIELLMHAAAVAKSGGMEFDKNTLAEAMAIMIEQIAAKFGITAETGGMLTDGEQKPAATGQGIIQGAMQ